MFNRNRILSISIIAAAAILSACGGQANAQTIPLNYKSTSGVPFSIQKAQKIVGLGTSVNVIDDTGFASTSSSAVMYTDSSYQVYTQIINDPEFLKLWLQIGTSTTWVNPAYFRQEICAGNKSVIRYKNMPTETLADNCQFDSSYKARTN